MQKKYFNMILLFYVIISFVIFGMEKPLENEDLLLKNSKNYGAQVLLALKQERDDLLKEEERVRKKYAKKEAMLKGILLAKKMRRRGLSSNGKNTELKKTSQELEDETAVSDMIDLAQKLIEQTEFLNENNPPLLQVCSSSNSHLTNSSNMVQTDVNEKLHYQINASSVPVHPFFIVVCGSIISFIIHRFYKLCFDDNLDRRCQTAHPVFSEF